MKAVVYHHDADADGWSSWFILDQHLERLGVERERFGIDYSRMPSHEEIVSNCEGKDVHLADFTFPPETMVEVREKANSFTWIDHHISAINDSIEHGYSDLEGIREDGTAASRLCWRYLNADEEEPTALRLLGKWDVFDQDEEWETQVLPLTYLLLAQETIVNPDLAGEAKSRAYWAELFSHTDNTIWELLPLGNVVLSYVRNTNNLIVGSGLHIAIIQGERYLALNTAGKGSMMFDSVSPFAHDTQGMLVYYFTGKGWSCSLYGWEGSPDLSEIATEFGGGGHRAACGFRVGVLSSAVSVFESLDGEAMSPLRAE